MDFSVNRCKTASASANALSEADFRNFFAQVRHSPRLLETDYAWSAPAPAPAAAEAAAEAGFCGDGCTLSKR